jgi:hypothetical protein
LEVEFDLGAASWRPRSNLGGGELEAEDDLTAARRGGRVRRRRSAGVAGRGRPGRWAARGRARGGDGRWESPAVGGETLSTGDLGKRGEEGKRCWLGCDVRWPRDWTAIF